MSGLEQCPFHADMIVRTSGGGWKRIPYLQCIAALGHWDKHEFYCEGGHAFGATLEGGRWVTRR